MSRTEGAAVRAGTALRAEHLRKRYGRNLALSDLSISVAEGSIHALLGENGSGKSTFVKILAGILSPDEGSWSLADGEPCRFRAPRQAIAAGVSVVFQEILLADHRTVRDNVLLAQRALGRRPDQEEGDRMVRSALRQVSPNPPDLRRRAGRSRWPNGRCASWLGPW